MTHRYPFFFQKFVFSHFWHSGELGKLKIEFFPLLKWQGIFEKFQEWQWPPRATSSG